MAHPLDLDDHIGASLCAAVAEIKHSPLENVVAMELTQYLARVGHIGVCDPEVDETVR